MRDIRKSVVTVGVALVALTVGPIAFAHVRVSPTESQAGAEQEYAARVPTERDTATVRVEIEFPDGVEVLELLPKEGWTVEATRDGAGRIVAATWTGGSIPPGQAQEFVFRARNPAAATTLVWRAAQVHEDGSRAEWYGESGSGSPAPTTVVQARP